MKSSAWVLVIASLLFGCVENRRTWFIRQNQVSSGDPPDCLVPDDTNAAFRTAGLLDVGLRSDYILTPLIENQMMKRKDYAHLRDEPNGIQVDGAIVRGWCNEARGTPDLTDVEGFFSPASSYIDPEDTGASAFIAIHAGMSDALRGGTCCPGGAAGCDEQIVILGVKMTGITNGGIETETPEFFYPVFVCEGCLVACNADADDEDQAGPDCCVTDEPSTNPCTHGQDDALDCRWCRGDPLCLCGNPCT